MAETKITCPECRKVLRPAKPLPAGQRVKCPQCSTVFVPGDEDEAAPAVSKAPAKSAAKAKPAAKAADKPAKPKPAPRSDDDDDDGGPNAYEFIDDHRKEDEPEIDYVPDTAIKDLRGPAQEAVMKPSNWILRYGVGGFICWLFLLVIIMLPVVFPVPKQTNADGTPVEEKKDDKKEKKDSSLFTMYRLDLMELAAWQVLVYSFLCIVGMAYCGVITFGGVKMQSLESRLWGIIVSILTIVPITSGGVFCLLSIAGTFLYVLMFDEESVYFLLPVVCAAAFIPNVLIGIWGLVKLLNPDVIDGYNYIPEDERRTRRGRA